MNKLRPKLLLAVLTAALVVLGSGQEARAAGPSGSIQEVTHSAAGGRVVFLAEDVKPGTTLRPETVRIAVGTADLEATVLTGSEQAQAGDVPRRVTILAIDTSGSMAGRGIRDAKRAAQVFVDTVPADVLVGVVTYADRASVLLPATADRSRLRAAIASLGATGNTALYDGLFLASGQFKGGDERVLVVLSDGADTSSRASQPRAVAALQRAAVQAHFIGLRTDGAQTARLAEMADSLGAAVHRSNNAKELAGAFSRAAAALEQRVVLKVPGLAALEPGTHRLSVAMQFGSDSVSATKAFTIADSVDEDIPATAAPATAPDPETPWQLLTLVFVALLAIALAVALPRRPSPAAARMRQLEAYTVDGRGMHKVPMDQEGALAQNVLRLSEDFVRRRGWSERIALQLDRADLRLRPHEWVVIQAAVILAAAALFGVLVYTSIVGFVLGGLLGWLGTVAYVKVKATRRLKAFDEHLPDTLQLVASSLQTGFSLGQAFDAAARDGRAPVSTELHRALNESRLGADLEDALDRVAYRMDSKDFRWAVMAIRIQREVGGNLAEVLRTTVKTIRDRAGLRRQVRALSAEGRLSMYILMALPIGLALFLVTFRREYVSLLWTTGLGLLMSAVAVVSMALGYFVMRQIVKVDV